VKFLKRTEELARLGDMGPGLAVVWGRRRVGKTRLLLEWCQRERGIYAVADQSAPETQRAWLASTVAQTIHGFGDVTYPDWATLFARIAAAGLPGPLVIDELPYLVAGSPELPSVLQRWLDHDARRAKLRVALAGSSQRMMQGLVLSHDAPLYGRASVVFDLQPIEAAALRDALGPLADEAWLEHYTAWGGIPRYWELAQQARGTARDRLGALAMTPLGPLFDEPSRLLLEELPPAPEVRPLLDAIGAGAHRLSEIAGRIGRNATALARPLDRLIGMGLVVRETPFGEPTRGGKRSLYKIADPFLRFWFRVVAPNRSVLVAGTAAARRALLERHWPALVAQTFEELCRARVPLARVLARHGTWGPASRWWQGSAPEWDLVARDLEADRVLVGEVRAASVRSTDDLRRTCERFATRPLPPALQAKEIVRVLFVVGAPKPRPKTGAVHVVTLGDLLR
jgi:AAA+ ATPase superfamily predicted ATPase